MREILFRGRIDERGKQDKNGEWLTTGDWIYGYYNKYRNISNELYFAITPITEDGEAMTSCMRRVLPETVGQFTGLHDKDGVKIFDGDILNCLVLRLGGQYSNWSQQKNIEHGKCRYIPMRIVWGECSYDCKYGGWKLELTDKARELIKEYEEPIGKEYTKQTINYFNIKIDECEVISNIHDNPELLKGGAK